MTLGHSHYRIDAPGKVTGATLYPGDLTPGNLLHAKILFSGRPHARMVRMDVRAAEAVPGVVTIFTAKDVPVNEYGLTMFDQPVLVGLSSPPAPQRGETESGPPEGGDSIRPRRVPADVSRWEGDQVAVIVAETEEAAAKARELIQIEWEDLPLVPDVATALKDEVILHPEHGSNRLTHYKIRKGDMAAGWAAAEVIVEGRYQLPHQEHAFLQPEAALSYVDEAGRVTVEIAGQWVHEDQGQVAHALDLPADQVRIIYPAIGGAFGGREDMSLQIVMALAAWRLKERGEARPIRIIWTREESVIGHHKRHRATVETRWGATKAGQITAVETKLYLDAGAYNYTSNKVLGNAHLCVSGPYEIPNARIDSYAIYTTNVPGGAFRGFGAPQGAFVAENQMTKLAAALGMDPVELRLKNVLREGSEGITQTVMPAGVSMAAVIEGCALEAGWRKEKRGWQAPPAPQRGEGVVFARDGVRDPSPVADRLGAGLVKSFQSLPPDPKAIRWGRGFACAYKNVGYSFGFPERCEATIELYGGAEIERVVLRQAGADVGQGAHTVFKQMAAAAVGVPLEQVDLILSDTAQTGDSGSASASRLTWMAGNAIRGAGEKALAAWRSEERPARGHFRYIPPATEMMHPETGVAYPNFSYSYVAQCVELAVDLETGHLHVSRVVCADDVGKAINPDLIVGQIEGGVVQAYGYAVSEDLQIREGHILNPRLSTYLIPGIQDIPEQVEPVILEIPDPLGPWGARGVGEMPFLPLAPAITAALYDATGVWFDEIPLTPGRVVAKLREHGLGVDV
jgi:CO/xanthine dehydrogenase Mo-binding subunit